MKEDSASAIYRALRRQYPDARCELRHRNPYELLVATILSAQCTDERVNQVTPALFARYPSARELAAADPAELEAIIRPTGFFRNKAKSLRLASRQMVENFAGKVPDTMEGLLTLRGVARKTANVVLGTAFGRNDGVVVDTHVGRLSRRLGFSRHQDPLKIEQDLMRRFPQEEWTMLAHVLIWHGRRTCFARKPDCAGCAVREKCPKVGVPWFAETRKR